MLLLPAPRHIGEQTIPETDANSASVNVIHWLALLDVGAIGLVTIVAIVAIIRIVKEK